MRREVVNQNALASTFVGSPDPLQKAPPFGEELIVEWRLSPWDLERPLTLVFTVLYYNYEEETFCYPISSRRGSVTHSLLDALYREKGGVLTYKAEIISLDTKEVIYEWKQQLWTELIRIEE